MPMCFYAPSAKYWPIIDTINPATGRGCFGGTLESVKAEYGADTIIMDLDAAHEAACARAVQEPREIDEERFMYLLEVLPPMRWERRHDCESFRMSEFTTGDVTAAVVRRGNRYFCWDDRISMKHDAIMAKLDAWLAAQPAAA